MYSLFDIMYNNVVNSFFIYHGIKPDLVSQKVDTKIYRPVDFLGVFAKNAIYEPSSESTVSIGDIYGCTMNHGDNNDSVFELLNDYYKEEKPQKKGIFQKSNDHCNRSNDNLNLSASAMVEKSNNSPEPIKVCCVDKDNKVYLINDNGMHRFLAMKSLYLAMLSDNPQLIDQIKKKFMVKVQLRELNEVKTFCYYIIKRKQKSINKSVGCRLNYQNFFDYDGRLDIGIFDNGKQVDRWVLTDKELLEIAKPLIEEDLEYYMSIDVPVFKEFMNSIGFGFNPNLNR